MFFSLFGIVVSILPRNYMEVPMLIFNKKFDNYVLSIGSEDIVNPNNKTITILPISKNDFDKELLLVHIDQHGHAVIKDQYQKYRSIVTGNTLEFTVVPHAHSDIWFKKVSYGSKPVFRIINDEMCLSAGETAGGIKTVTFEKCTISDSQVWGALSKQFVLNKIDNTMTSTTFETDSIAETLERLDKYAMKRT